MDVPPTSPETCDNARSYHNLRTAIRKASECETRRYNSAATRAQIERIFHERFGKTAHGWQVDVTEAMLVGLDSIVIAGTGAGKTMPFMMPLLLDPESKCIIISPLKVLQEDQVCLLSCVYEYTN